jgi:hypothetical protein
MYGDFGSRGGGIFWEDDPSLQGRTRTLLRENNAGVCGGSVENGSGRGLAEDVRSLCMGVLPREEHISAWHKVGGFCYHHRCSCWFSSINGWARHRNLPFIDLLRIPVTEPDGAAFTTRSELGHEWLVCITAQTTTPMNRWSML